MIVACLTSKWIVRVIPLYFDKAPFLLFNLRLVVRVLPKQGLEMTHIPPVHLQVFMFPLLLFLLIEIVANFFIIVLVRHLSQWIL